MKQQHIDVLKCLVENIDCDGFNYADFLAIKKRLNNKYTRSEIRLSCRYLKRKGYADFESGLWYDDGEMAGSGYGATKAGQEFLEGVKE